MNDQEMRDAMKNGWSGGKPETVCGDGSTMLQTENVRKILPTWVRRYNISLLADIGAGDLNWISKVELGCEYVGFDLFPRKPEVIQYDVCAAPLPITADAILCRHVLNHLSIERVLAALWNIRNSARLLIATQFSGLWQQPSVAGQFARYDLTLQPFLMGKPIEVARDCKISDIAIWRL